VGASEKFLYWNAQSTRDFVNIEQTYVSLTTFNAADISTVKITGECYLLPAIEDHRRFDCCEKL